ncbi:cation:proton antiporter [Croceicoccus naphthovorans]|uniref:Sodium:proton antiporter n=1 Tax=Croceicoccus naphthovorans TaxID=1348774 RepID=A0A0G3XE24_9SPHN|nr:sodium:proton antiporter [Croceicoccus naphthovorans]AKM09795.1 sodium:proton antiporter [Croceicoccus naphthovorans]MBB3990651.1 NhaP-type Na+/H+ or K+/H+ antiporter [Croceicoccus naphthovorans]
MEEQALVIALVGILGIGAQWVAWRTGWPAIVLMLGAGFLAGPALGIIDPHHAFGELLEPMISIGVALILFEGGLSLDFRELRRTGSAVWRLVVFGVPFAWFFGSLACYYIAGLVWPVSILFAGILVVTGPTVVLPMLRQSSVAQRPSAVLKWEAIVNDPFGAMCAVLAYEYFRASANGATLIDVLPGLAFATLAAAVLGYAAAWLIAWSFPRGFVPEYLKAPVLLVVVVALFVGSNMIQQETGLVAVTIMGVALANMNVDSLRDIHPFKQNIAVILVSGIFILLSSSLEIEAIEALEWQFGLFLLAVLFLVRPATVLLSLAFSPIPWNERLFLAWIAPRGIVAVAISGLFALRLSDLGYADGTILITLSFAVCVATIVAHGFTVAPVSRWLKVTGSTSPGLLLVGATPWSIALARDLNAMKVPVTIADTSWWRLSAARQQGLSTYHGEILAEATEHSLDLSQFQVLVAATENEAYNALVCNEFAPEIGRDSVYQLGETGHHDDPRSLPPSIRGRALFQSGVDMNEMHRRQQKGWEFRKTRLSEKFDLDAARAALPAEADFLLLVRKDGNLRFFTHAARPTPGPGDTVISYSPAEEPDHEKIQARREKKAKAEAKAAPKPA